MYLNINHDKHIWPTKNRVNMRLFLHFLVFYPLQQVQITCDSYCSRDGTSTKGALMYPNHSEDDSNSFETPTPTRRGKKICSGIPEPLPLMEGQGKSLKVLGFSQNQRADFLQILMRFGVGDYDWKQFAPRIKHKSYEEITEYGKLLLSHIAEDITDSPTFTGLEPMDISTVSTSQPSFEGHNSTVIAHGARGSGKTHIIQGSACYC
ncbi:CHD3-type chromatin-remodeling factor PICKLE-like isoform X3 [Vigna radiata var. radiata]|uniref:CHD3-type chromatin-remodeling factor PICKLE-like isoform X3 n=1 Tax=Vigna radiata var. radiata TaxID=3916 RepID=A0A3Q0FG54_VIGRR|nr:CHD3-type chromatin-remodeling factor PICKLE-like isoform X3 [Vigna radiata var. radiata]